MNGSCDSCHYISSGETTPGNNMFEMWDYAKYDLYKGITDVSADEAAVEVSYDQDHGLRGTDQMFFESLNNEPAEWRTTTDPAVADEWIISIGGEVENPIEMSVSELVETFGTQTHTMKQVCIANGNGGAWIFQGEFTGVSMKDIIDYVKPADTVTNLKCTTEDGYNLVSPSFYAVNNEDCLLVTEINGEPLPVTQGYPLTLIVPRGSAASYMKAIQTIDFVTTEGYVLNTDSSPSSTRTPAPMTASPTAVCSTTPTASCCLPARPCTSRATPTRSTPPSPRSSTRSTTARRGSPWRRPTTTRPAGRTGAWTSRPRTPARTCSRSVPRASLMTAPSSRADATPTSCSPWSRGRRRIP